VLGYVAPGAAEEQLRQVLDGAVAQQRFDQASATATDLANLLRNAGRLEEALALVEQQAELTRRAGLGPWTQLGDRGQRLQLLAMMGRNDEVLAEVQTLRNEMAALPESSDQLERVNPWNVREVVLDTGREAARNLGRWQEALEFNAERIRSKQARGATDHEVASSRFNDYFPLLRLGELEAAGRVLEACREIFEAEGDLGMLGQTFSALGDLEDERGHPGEAIRLEQTALRYEYAGADPEAVTVSHRNLANYLGRAGGDPALVVAHRLAAAYVGSRTGSGQLPGTLDALAGDLAAAGAPSPLPASFGELCERVGRVEGVRLAELAARLPARQESDDQVLAELVQLARTQYGTARYLAAWAPVLDGVVAAAGGDQRAAAELEPVFAELAASPDWATPVAVLRRIIAGERGEDLAHGLDAVDTAIVAETLRRLAAP
jgi:tetratricopeptide (TPR) repeat protein